MTWNDSTEAGYRIWYYNMYGEYPPEVKMKEVEMEIKKGETINEATQREAMNAKIENFMPPEENFETEPLYRLSNSEVGLIDLRPPKRTRRPKGIPGVIVSTTKNANIPLWIPERPEGMDKVTISIRISGVVEDIKIAWPEGMTAMEALVSWFEGK